MKPTWRDGITVHTLADTFPMMSDGELQELAADIKMHGQREPVLFAEIDGEQVLIDGRHRLEACYSIGLKPKSKVVSSKTIEKVGGIEAFILSMNVHRRHLSRADRSAAIKRAIEANPEKSNVAIAKEAGVDEKTVRKARAKLPTSDKSEVRTGIDGRKRKVPKKAPPQKSEEADNLTLAGTNIADGTSAAIDGLVNGNDESPETSAERRKAENAAAEAGSSKHALKKFVHACDVWLKEMDAGDLVAASAHFQTACGRVTVAP